MDIITTEHNQRLAEFLGLTSVPLTESLNAEPLVINTFRPLEEVLAYAETVVSPVELNARNFMYMGQKRQGYAVIALYKHSFTRRYLNVDPLSLETYQYNAQQDRYNLVPLRQAIEWVKS